uniref:Uncharacterized protein n=1 Tax=Anguilla anguilla TaxID=7936 RepID=A0A0E9S7X4_ANGAN
MDCRVYKSL